MELYFGLLLKVTRRIKINSVIRKHQPSQSIPQNLILFEETLHTKNPLYFSKKQTKETF